MPRTTGTYRVFTFAGVSRVGGARGEEVRAFVPRPLPPADPPLVLDDRLSALHAEAVASVGKLGVASAMVPSAQWFLYGFARTYPRATLAPATCMDWTRSSLNDRGGTKVSTVKTREEGETVSRSSGNPIAFGATPSGRVLCCVFRRIDGDIVQPITAFEVKE